MNFVEPVRDRQQQIRLQRYVSLREKGKIHGHVRRWPRVCYVGSVEGPSAKQLESVRTQDTCIVRLLSLRVVVAHIQQAGSFRDGEKAVLCCVLS